MRYRRQMMLALAAVAALSPAAPAIAADGPVLFPPEQFGRAYLNLPQSTLQLENVLGRNANFERLIDYNATDRFRILSNPVGRLDLLVRTGGKLGVITCTASILSREYVLTNNHCAPGPHNPEIRKVILLMNFYGVETEDKVERFDLVLPPVEHDAALDYAVYRVVGDPAKRYGTVTLNPRDPEPGESLIVIHHPAGLAKHLTRGGCRAAAPKAIRDTDILHRCDTLPGSSGSPVLASESGEVIGLHYAGSASPSPSSYNYGKRLAGIAKKSRIIAALLREAEAEKRRKAEEERLARQRHEAELRAKLERELREKIRRDLNAGSGAGGAGPAMTLAMRSPPITAERLTIADVAVPLPDGAWHQIFTFRSDRFIQGVEMEYRGLAELGGGRVRQLLVAMTNTGGRDRAWVGNSFSYCDNDLGPTFFSHFDTTDEKRVVCWRLRKFKWPEYDGQIGPGGIRAVRGIRNKVSYFLTEQKESAPFYGFSFHVSIGGQFIRALFAFNAEVFDFERRLCCGNEAKIEATVKATASEIVAALQRILRHETVDYAALRKAFTTVR